MRTLLVFLKYPAPGRTKTRLGESLGEVRAAELYREWISMVMTTIQSVRDRTRVVACYDGAAESAFAPWHPLADVWCQQPDGDLGDRLTAAFLTWQREKGPTVAIGTDCLDLKADHIEGAFAALASHDVVFGPASDGGYYLVGLARPLPGFFGGIPWSTSTTLEAHLAKCARHGWSVEQLETLDDIDTADDWAEYQRRSRAAP